MLFVAAFCESYDFAVVVTTCCSFGLLASVLCAFRLPAFVRGRACALIRCKINVQLSNIMIEFLF